MRKPQHILDAQAFTNANPRYVQTATRHVWRDTKLNIFVFEDETNNLMDHLAFTTEQEAEAELHRYCDYITNGPRD